MVCLYGTEKTRGFPRGRREARRRREYYLLIFHSFSFSFFVVYIDLYMCVSIGLIRSRRRTGMISRHLQCSL
jgi:hypothetical protein